MDANIDESDLYTLINVSRTASEAEIKKAFKKRALELHPDKNPGSEEMMKRLNMAKDTLLDPEKRQKYDDDNEDVGTARDISGFLHCGKRLSRRYKQKLAKYIADFDKLNIKDNFKVAFDTLANLNDKLFKLINDSITHASQDKSTSGQAKDTEALRSFFYEGKYVSMARYLIDNHCNSSSISTLHQNLTSGRDVSCTPLSFQAGLLLLKGQLSAQEHKHEESLKAFQQAVLTCPTDQVISAANILMGDSHLIAATQVIMHQLLGNIDIAQAHKYQDRLKRTNHLRMISKFEKGVLQDTQTSNWDKAMMYIDLTMATSGIAVIHCFVVAMTYLLEQITENEGEDVARVYAICNIICELAINVSFLARRCALPITEMHFNKLSFIISRKAHEILRSKLKNYKMNSRKLFGHRRTETMIITETHFEMYKMMANSIYRLIRVSPFVDLPLTLVADMIYLDVISDQFVEEFYKSRVNRNGKETWSHLYSYYLLECMWKTGNDNKLGTYREKSMKSLLEKNRYLPEEVEETMWWDVINRDRDGWLDIDQTWLRLEGTNYDSVDGVEIDVERGTFRVLCTPSPPQSSDLFDHLDMGEVFYNGLQYSIFTLDPPDNDLQYHPFHQLKFLPPSLEHATNFLQTLLHADYLLKMMSMGVEVSANAPHLFRSASKDGFLRLLPTKLQEKVKPVSQRRGGNREENVHRFWIESGDLEYSRVDLNDGKTLKFMFGPCKMQVKTQLMKHNSDGELVDDSEEEDDSDEDQEDVGNNKKPAKPKKKRITAETEFANDFTECYNEVGRYFPILLRLRELMKLLSVYRILSNIFDSLETAKKELNVTLTTRYKKMFGEVRKQISYPQNNSSNVNSFYQSMLRDQGINESNLAAGEEARAKREIRRQLDEVDAQIVVDITEKLASLLEIRNCSQFTTKVRNWLNDSIFTSYTREIVAYIVEQVYPREFEKLDRFAKNAALKGIRFSGENDKDSGLSTTDECPWVPAAFSREDFRRVYGGVSLIPQLKNVTQVTGGNSNNEFTRNPGEPSAGGENNSRNNNNEGRDVIKLSSVTNIDGVEHRYVISC